MTTIAVTPRSFRSTPGRHQDLLERAGLEVRTPDLGRHLTEDEMVDLVSGCSGLIVGTDPVTDDVLTAGPLRAVVKYGSGMDNIDLAAADRRDVVVADTRGENARSVAELTIGLLFACARRVTLHDRRVREGSWQRETGIELAGRTLGVVGLGAVGEQVADLARCVGMEVVAHDPYVAQAEVPLVDLTELLDRCDALTLHAPLTDTTQGMIGRDEVDRMRPGAIIVNTARGGLVDADALAEALRRGRLAAAAFDSFVEEPPIDSPLVDLDTFISSPHAGAATVDAVERTGAAAVRELCRALDVDVPETS